MIVSYVPLNSMFVIMHWTDPPPPPGGCTQSPTVNGCRRKDGGGANDVGFLASRKLLDTAKLPVTHTSHGEFGCEEVIEKFPMLWQ